MSVDRVSLLFSLPRARTRGRGTEGRDRRWWSVSMREYVISRDTWQRLFLFLGSIQLLFSSRFRSIVRSIVRFASTKKWIPSIHHRFSPILFEHESIYELEEQFPRMDIPDLDHVRDSVPDMHRDMDNLLPRIVVHNMRLQVATE